MARHGAAPTTDTASVYRHPWKTPSYCKFIIERRVNCGVRHQAPTVGAAELVGAAVGHAHPYTNGRVQF
ncbi:hypothetical protein F443_03475 [Phytophthora nicotianae P1569]|uniref:Uncharacterized protein n=1 Tax=Phytophthora nicotianae P1569 TaxID=1317065 RepID=V9FRA9_PHYNI|nr:hypothetical protein F443_03475 [Phytophthora nicotianae P1569]